MKNLISKILVVILATSTVSQLSALVLTPKRWWECTFDPKKNKCNKEEKKAALVGSIVGALGVGTVAAVGAGAAYGGYRYSQANQGQSGGISTPSVVGQSSVQPSQTDYSGYGGDYGSGSQYTTPSSAPTSQIAATGMGSQDSRATMEQLRGLLNSYNTAASADLYNQIKAIIENSGLTQQELTQVLFRSPQAWIRENQYKW